MARTNVPDDAIRNVQNGDSQSEDKSWLRPASSVRSVYYKPPRSPPLVTAGSAQSPISGSTANLSLAEIIESKPAPKLNHGRKESRIEQTATWLLSPTLFHVGVFLTSIYSTILSTIWFLIAVLRPHWGTIISPTGVIQPTVASILFAGFAKSIEMSYVTIMIVCLGQYLTRKAKLQGITITDLQLRTMLLLPCGLITRRGGFRTLWRSGVLGLVCIVAYLAATFYTTASDAIVSPRLSMTPAMTTNLSAYLQTSIANAFYIGQNCPNPRSSVQNSTTCITTEYAGSSYRNYLQYLSNWQTAVNSGQEIYIDNKPEPVASFGESIAVHGKWLHSTNYTVMSQLNDRLVVGAHMAMPHAGVVNATTIAENKLNVDNQHTGQLSINAKAVTPVVGVTCTAMNATELVPMVYMNWTHPDTGPMDATEFDNTYKNATWRTNATAVDSLFGFNNETRHRPVFYKLPEPYNTMIDGEGTYRDMLYILLSSNVSTTAALQDPQYTLCGMNFTLIGGCSTVYAANTSGTSLELDCDKSNDMAFPTDNVSIANASFDWVIIAAVWGRSISLGARINDGRASIAEIVTQLAPKDSQFDPTQPSMVDSLAMLSAGTMLQSTIDAPFDGLWSFDRATGGPNNVLPQAVTQQFEARVQITDYSSGITNDWRSIFLAVLLVVMVLNLYCLAYLIYLAIGRLSISKKGISRVQPHELQEDITELQEVFTTAISSPAVCIFDSADNGRAIQWKYQNGLFRPSNFNNRASINEKWTSRPHPRRMMSGNNERTIV